MDAPGSRRSAKLLNAIVLVPPLRVAAALQLEPGERAAKIERIRYASKMPMTLEEAWVPTRCTPTSQAWG